jgi:hypothetical protein
METNPFSELFTASETKKIVANPLILKVNEQLENVFLITLNKVPQKNKQLVFMEEMGKQEGPYFNLENIEK